MSRASARSRRSGETASPTSATRSMPSRSRLTSRRYSAARMSTTAACWIGSSRPTAPKSMSPSVPSSNAKMLPGCGSAWKKPSRSTWSSVEREQLLGERGAVDVRRVQPLGVGQGEAFETLLDEQPARGELEVDLRDPDRATWGRAAGSSPPSRPPRAGSRARRGGSARIGRASRPNAFPGRTRYGAARGWRRARARRGRAPSRPRCRDVGPSRRRPHRMRNRARCV